MKTIEPHTFLTMAILVCGWFYFTWRRKHMFLKQWEVLYTEKIPNKY